MAEAIALEFGICNGRACTRARGDERLSGSQKGELQNAAGGKRSPKSKDGGKKVRGRIGDVGRALRTVYDDTLREPVPDDFSDLLGKLS